MGKIKETQHDRILKYMRDFGSITTLSAFTDLGITKLTTRISEMRRLGIVIEGTPETVENRYGDKCHINRYRLIEEPEQLTLNKLLEG